MSNESNYDALMSWLGHIAEGQDEYLQAVKEIAQDIIPVFNANDDYKRYDVVRRLCIPERIVQFSVTWLNDNDEIEINRGWRVQHNGLIGPYKGGLRFHPTVTESVLKFLAFEQTFKNALTGLPIGGAKGGSDFNPKGRSDREVMRFCQAFMTELQRHIGPHTDVPAGDINVSSREIGYLYGQYRKMHNQFGGALTGKDISFGGSYVRTEATGYGLIYMLCHVLADNDTNIKDKRIAISGAGNVALHAAQKAISLGGKVISLSNSRGVLFKNNGFTETDITFAIAHAHNEANILTALQEKHGGQWQADTKPWDVDADIALPCATQNELNADDAQNLIHNGVKFILEGANMPCTSQAQDKFHHHKLAYVPGKASNAGGVALSGLEMTQNASFERASYDELDKKLHTIISHIHLQCKEEGKDGDYINYAKGANIAGFRRLADAMVSQGV